jgi:heme A synthase
VKGSRFRVFSVVVLVATLGVILWGAYVRATGSGAGCGSHWPTCNGEVIPRAPNTQTLIEYTHRTTSGLAYLLVVAQLVWALRAFPRGHLARRGAALSLLLMTTEALVGAGLVLFEMVAGNKSVARGAWMIAHLGNTFALVAALTYTAWAAGPRRRVEAPPRGFAPALGLGLVGVLAVGMSGAIAALGDTLFPSATLAEGLAQDLSPAAHLFVRLRVWHPIMATLVGLFILAVVGRLAARPDTRLVRTRATLVGGLVVAQIAVGFLNLGLLAPIPLQLLHLLLADLLWIGLVTLWLPLRRPVGARLSAVAPAA